MKGYPGKSADDEDLLYLMYDFAMVFPEDVLRRIHAAEREKMQGTVSPEKLRRLGYSEEDILRMT